MPLYATEAGERVLVPADHPEGRRLAASPHWSVVDETPDEAAGAPAVPETDETPRRSRARATRTRTTDSAAQEGAESDEPSGDDTD